MAQGKKIMFTEYFPFTGKNKPAFYLFHAWTGFAYKCRFYLNEADKSNRPNLNQGKKGMGK